MIPDELMAFIVLVATLLVIIYAAHKAWQPRNRGGW